MKVAIVGAGISGTSAALHAAEKKYNVSLFEATDSVGGKARSFFDSKSNEFIDNGQHALMGAYTEFLNICKILGTTKYIYEPQKLSIAFASPNSSLDTLEQTLFQGKYGTLLGLLRFKKLDFASKFSIIQLFSKLLISSPKSGESCISFLKKERQTGQAIEIFWEPLILAVMNASVNEAPAALLITVIKKAFLGNSFESKLLLPSTAINKLIAPIESHLKIHKGVLHLSESVKSVEKVGQKFRIATNKANYEFDKVIFSLSPKRIQKILLIKSQFSLAIDTIVSNMQYSPIISAYLWYNKYLELPEIIALTQTKTQWIFNRSKILQEDKGTFPFSLACTISAADEIENMKNDQIIDLMDEEIKQCLPHMSGNQLEYARVVRERSATPLFTKDNIHLRPNNQTDIPGLFVAGDWTDTGLPATIEGAALSGKLAAESLDSTD